MVRDYDSTIARIAGNIAAGMVGEPGPLKDQDTVACYAVSLAYSIVDVVRDVEAMRRKQELAARREIARVP